MGLKKKPNFRRLEKRIIKSKVQKLELLSSEIIIGIIERSQSGKDVKLQVFNRYSKKYSIAKKKKYGSSRPNMTRSGDMLNGIGAKSLANGVRFYFTSKHEKDKASSNMRKRKFFGVDRKQKAWIKKKLSKL